MSLMDRAPVFIVGSQRSGTTWVQRLLAAHPRIVSGQESHLFSSYLAPLWQRWQFESDFRREGNRTIGLACYLDEEEFLDEMRGLARRVFAKLEQAKPEATILVEKTPDHALHLPLIKRLFPDSVIIHVLRDGRDVVASLLDARRKQWGKRWAPPSAEQAARRWVEWVRSIRSHMGDFEKSLTIRYEDLVAGGPSTLAGLYAFLGVPLPAGEVEEIHDRFRFDAGKTAESMVIQGTCRDAASGEPEGFFRRGSSGGWKQDLSPREQQVFQAIAGDLLVELGYSSTSSKPSHALARQTSLQEPNTTAESFVGFRSTAEPGDRIWVKPARLDVLDTCNAQMLHRERLYLYASVLALAPERCLEIGVAEGGSTQIIHAALRDLGRGRLISLDPQPSLNFDPDTLTDVVTFLRGPSPAAIPQARELAGGLFDFVLLDGDHSATGVHDDLVGLASVTRPGALILAHDAYYPGVAAGIDVSLAAGLPYTDGGIVTTTRHPGQEGGREATYAGFRLLIRTNGAAPGPWKKLLSVLPRRIALKVTHLLRHGLQRVQR